MTSEWLNINQWYMFKHINKPQHYIIKRITAFTVLLCSCFVYGCAPKTYKATVFHLGEYHSMTCTETEDCREDGTPRLTCTMEKGSP